MMFTSKHQKAHNYNHTHK